MNARGPLLGGTDALRVFGLWTQQMRTWGGQVILVLIAITLAGCRSEPPLTHDAVYEDSALRVAVPKGWYVLRSVRGGVVMRPGAVPMAGPGPVVAVLTEELPLVKGVPVEASLRKFVELSELAARESASGDLRRETIVLADRRVDAAVGTRKEGDRVTFRLAVVASDEMVYTLIAWDDSPDLGSTVKGILASLLLKEESKR